MRGNLAAIGFLWQAVGRLGPEQPFANPVAIENPRARRGGQQRRQRRRDAGFPRAAEAADGDDAAMRGLKQLTRKIEEGPRRFRMPLRSFYIARGSWRAAT